MRMLLAALCLSACSARSSAPVVEPELPAPAAIALVGKYGLAHACPVAGFVVTAAHVAYHPLMTGGGIVEVPLRYMYETAEGQLGTADPFVPNRYVDLAILATEPAITVFYPMGPMPTVGDRVAWVEYDFRKVDMAFRPRIRTARVVNRVAGHILLDAEPVPGASGSCLMNTRGEVVGIISFGHGTEEGKVFGGAVDLSTLPQQ